MLKSGVENHNQNYFIERKIFSELTKLMILKIHKYE